MAINSDSFLYSYLLDKTEPFKPTKENKAVKFPLKGIDFTTGQSIDLNNYQAFLPQKPEDVLGGAEFPVAKLQQAPNKKGGYKFPGTDFPIITEDELETPDTSPPLDERQEYLNMLDRAAAIRSKYGLQALRESALLQDQLSRGQFDYYIPKIAELTDTTKQRDLARQLGYERTSPRVQQALVE
ncbi:MAG: hypothetical protein JRE18_08785, partial [Deltaproteobacteria bacterium]|nr:hypothetical protein [Deltaproteobacteria bacterium]